MRAFPLLRFLALALLIPVAHTTAADASVTVATQQEHLGWHDAVIARNAVVEAVIVPSVGRVMQFRFVGETEGPFWENEKLAGQSMPADPWKAAHGSFGGDKTWPAPQSRWNWPPPDIFDAAALTAKVNADHSVTLTSPVSPRFGIRTVRHITLDPTEPVMRIETTYEKVSGEALPVAVWVITQFRDPVGVFVPIPAKSQFPDGHASNWKGPAKFLVREGDWLRITRDPAGSYKTGGDGSTLVWAGSNQLLRIDIPRVAGGSYPHDGCSVEVYTNADPVRYVELETLGAEKTLRPGERLSATNTYRLARRTAVPVETDVRSLLAR